MSDPQAPVLALPDPGGRAGRTRRSSRFVELIGRMAFLQVLLLTSILGSFLVLSEAQLGVAVPALVILFSYLLFCVLLASRVRSGLFGEIGFVFGGFVVAYSVLPALNFLVLDFNFPPGFDSLNFSVLNPQPVEIAVHLWRHCLFGVTVMVAYLVGRGRDAAVMARPFSPATEPRLVLATLAVVVACVAILTALSGSVDDYYGHYTRFDGLSWGLKRLAFLCLILKTGGYYLVLALLFSDFRRYRYAIVTFVVMAAGYELSYSLGSRIEALSILLAAACLYHLNVANVRVGRGIVFLFLLGILFTAVELYRAAEFDIGMALRNIGARGIAIAYEFGAVFYTSFHLYVERLNGVLPEKHWWMLFNDVFTIVPFYDHVEDNSQYWYARHYFPDAPVPPQTMGPIADSAIWGGETDLAIRGVLTGLGYGWFARWALKRRDAIVSLVAYVFVFSTSVIGLKYSLIYQISQMVRTLFPVLVLVYVISWLGRLRRGRTMTADNSKG